MQIIIFGLHETRVPIVDSLHTLRIFKRLNEGAAHNTATAQFQNKLSNISETQYNPIRLTYRNCGQNSLLPDDHHTRLHPSSTKKHLSPWFPEIFCFDAQISAIAPMKTIRQENSPTFAQKEKWKPKQASNELVSNKNPTKGWLTIFYPLNSFNPRRYWIR